jgi:hypothetical protein
MIWRELAPLPLSHPAVKYQAFRQTISFAPDFTVVNYWQKLPATLEQISATHPRGRGGGREYTVHSTQYTHLASLFLSFAAEPSGSGPQSGESPYHSWSLPRLYIYVRCHWAVPLKWYPPGIQYRHKQETAHTKLSIKNVTWIGIYFSTRGSYRVRTHHRVACCRTGSCFAYSCGSSSAGPAVVSHSCQQLV